MIKVIRPPKYSQVFLFTLGLCLRIINKIRRSMIGYTTPRTFSTKEIKRSVTYCLDVVRYWEEILRDYTGEQHPFSNKNVIELGPGPDLGTGLIIIALGAKRYAAVDKNKLIYKTPQIFYDTMLDHLKGLPGYLKAKAAVDDLQKNDFSEVFFYVYDPYFNLQKLPSHNFDILVSQAVLEHLVNIKQIFKILYSKMDLHSVMVHEVDLGTHTGLIRTIDPLNLLRYSDLIWNILKFDGSPNRLCMSDYRQILHQIGFVKIETIPTRVYDNEYAKRTKSYLAEKFKNYSDEDIMTKSFYLLASKEGG